MSKTPEWAKAWQLTFGSSAQTQRADCSSFGRTATTRAALRGVSILLLGESGTGKEMFVHAIHKASSRRDRSFLAINCAALSKTLLESELFRHVKGAFTGADRDRPGAFERAGLRKFPSLSPDAVNEPSLLLSHRLVVDDRASCGGRSPDRATLC
ncbi:MAG TPA: sigma 54-interacting transcriptional regulator [Planctomycetaceae bacterium]|nr:sigma 54-interacting transcriptional regulator [Planctomycetaceae bacterium]